MTVEKKAQNPSKALLSQIDWHKELNFLVLCGCLCVRGRVFDWVNLEIACIHCEDKRALPKCAADNTKPICVSAASFARCV